jgi:hypothetical protein
MSQSEREQTGSIGSNRNLPKTAFVSGHIDLSYETFILRYRDPLDAAIADGDNVILSNAGGADSMALQYIISHHVSAGE